MFPRLVVLDDQFQGTFYGLDEPIPYAEDESGPRVELENGKGVLSDYVNGRRVSSRVLCDCEIVRLGTMRMMYREHPGPVPGPIPGVMDLARIRESVDRMQERILDFPFYLSPKVKRAAVVVQGREHTLMSEMYRPSPFPLNPSVLGPILSGEMFVANEGPIHCQALNAKVKNFGAVYLVTDDDTHLEAEQQEILGHVLAFSAPLLAVQLEDERATCKLKRALEDPD